MVATYASTPTAEPPNPTPDNLLEHFREKHLQIYRYVCPTYGCGKGFRSRADMDTHINVAHVQ